VPLSIRLPLREAPYGDAQARPFFANLLPESGLRRFIARRLGISEQNDFALLEAVGGECAGAVSMLPTGEQAMPSADYRGYGGYNLPAFRPDIIQLGCWAHVRRKFDAASQAASPGAAHIARQGIKLIRDLYHLDNEANNKPPDEQKPYRQKVVKPHLEKIRDWMLENQARALGRGGLLASTFTYLYNQWEKLTLFLEDPYLELDNNKAERHIRPIAIGRKTWLFAKSEAGARATAIWYSVIETARANGLEPYW